MVVVAGDVDVWRNGFVDQHRYAFNPCRTSPKGLNFSPFPRTLSNPYRNPTRGFNSHPKDTRRTPTVTLPRLLLLPLEPFLTPAVTLPGLLLLPQEPFLTPAVTLPGVQFSSTLRAPSINAHLPVYAVL